MERPVGYLCSGVSLCSVQGPVEGWLISKRRGLRLSERRRSRAGEWSLLAVAWTSLENFKGERCLMGNSLEVQRNGVCLVPDVQLLQAGVYVRGRYRW